ncbi:MAG: zinc ribbon domain-containing protein [Gemmatimonadota bacterium]
MPTYEFRLPDGTIIERSFKISEVPAEIPNPNGEGTAVRIISGGAALLFKGSGFYLTDYGRNAHRTQGDAPKPAGAGESKGETKATPKADAGGSSGASAGGESKAAPAPKSEPKSSGSGPAAP